MPLPLDLPAKLALAPLLAAQGLTVRRRALILPEAAGPREGRTGPDNTAPLRLLIIGDSSAAGVGAPDQASALAGTLAQRLGAERAVHWRVIARTGATSAATLRRLQAEPPASGAAPGFDVAIVALGVNDVTHMVRIKPWLASLAELRATLASRFGVTSVLHSGLPPMGSFPALPQPLRWVMGRTAARFDAALAADVAGLETVHHLAFDMPLARDLMAEDGFHPSPAGYAAWAQGLAPAVLDLFASQRPGQTAPAAGPIAPD